MLSPIIFIKKLLWTFINPNYIFRIDKEFCLQNLDSDQAKRMFHNFFPSTTNELLYELESKFEKIGARHSISPAAFENFLSRIELGAEEAIGRLDELENHFISEMVSRDINKTMIYRIKGYDKKWEPSGEPRRRANWDALVHDHETKNNILNDVTTFLQDRQLFQAHGLPLRRVYLFHGPQGTGKLSFVLSLAGKLDYSICLLSLNEKDLTASMLAKCMGEVPHRCLILIENVDDSIPSSIKRRLEIKTMLEEQGCEVSKPKISILDFCNVIDNFESDTSPIVIMTAKNKDDIAPELFQAGR